MALPDLVTLVELKALLDVPDTSQDTKLAAAIVNASSAVRTYTERSFGAPAVAGTKTYAYDFSGWLDIDDATVVTSVVLDGTTLTSNFDYSVGPDRGYVAPDAPLIFEWIELRPGFGQSPEMGFMRNLDTLPLYGKTRRFATVDVTGTFGYPVIPSDVKQAALWTATEFATVPQPFASVSIMAYSIQQNRAMVDAIPGRAKELLAAFRRGLY